MWLDGTTYRGECNKAGGSDFNDLSSLVVINSIIAALATTGGNIFIHGPISIVGLDSLSHDIHLTGCGHVEITTTAAGATTFVLAESATVSNVYMKHGGTIQYYWNWTTAYAEYVHFTNLPSLGGTSTGISHMIWDGDLNFEAAGGIYSTRYLWIYNPGTAQSECMLSSNNATSLSIRNVADSDFRDLKIRNIYLDGGYITPTGNMVIQTAENAANYLGLYTWTGAAQTLTLKLMNDNAIFHYQLSFLDNGIINTAELANKTISFMAYTGAALHTVATLKSDANPSFHIDHGEYHSLDGTEGATDDVVVGAVTLSFKNGLFVGHT
jgi:hypothetical protein